MAKFPDFLLKNLPVSAPVTPQSGSGFLVFSVIRRNEETNENFWVGAVPVTGDAPLPVFLQVSRYWVRTFGNAVLESPHIFVEFDENSTITFWQAIQEKDTPVT